MDKILAMIGKIPPKTLGLAAMLLLGTLILLLAYAVIDNRTVELWPPKIHARESDNSAKGNTPQLEMINALISGIDVPILVYKKQEKVIIVVAANDAAADFYVVSKEQIIGKSPADLHLFIKRWISNFGEWSAEQMERIAQSSATNAKPIGKTKVPMKLTTSHPAYQGNWYITSNYIKVNETQLIVSRFSANADLP